MREPNSNALVFKTEITVKQKIQINVVYVKCRNSENMGCHGNTENIHLNQIRVAIFLLTCLRINLHHECHCNHLDQEVHDQTAASVETNVLRPGDTAVPKTESQEKLAKMYKTTPRCHLGIWIKNQFYGDKAIDLQFFRLHPQK